MMKLITYLTTFIIIVLAELGDKTQFATLIFASNNPKRKWQVFLAAALALFLCVTIEVTVGLTLARHISPSLINKAAGIMFLLVGIYTGFPIFKEFLLKYSKKQKKQVIITKEKTHADEILQG